jgi:hypothetical protein
VALPDIMVNITGSFVSPSADATLSPQLFAPAGLIASVLDGFTIWKFLLTLFVGAVIYDQCMCDPSHPSPVSLWQTFVGPLSGGARLEMKI